MKYFYIHIYIYKSLNSLVLSHVVKMNTASCLECGGMVIIMVLITSKYYFKSTFCSKTSKTSFFVKPGLCKDLSECVVGILRSKQKSKVSFVLRV